MGFIDRDARRHATEKEAMMTTFQTSAPGMPPLPMTHGHVALAIMVATIWGIAFVVSKIGLESFSPPQLTALRFMVGAVAAVVLPPPPISRTSLVLIGLTMFTGQFLLQFFGIANGMPAGRRLLWFKRKRF